MMMYNDISDHELYYNYYFPIPLVQPIIIRIRQALEFEPIPEKLTLIDRDLVPGALNRASAQPGGKALNCIELLLHGEAVGP